jgi:hypothetical protein
VLDVADALGGSAVVAEEGDDAAGASPEAHANRPRPNATMINLLTLMAVHSSPRPRKVRSLSIGSGRWNRRSN